jgi:hypothetical protein
MCTAGKQTAFYNPKRRQQLCLFRQTPGTRPFIIAEEQRSSNPVPDYKQVTAQIQARMHQKLLAN